MVKFHTEYQRLKLPENTIYINIFLWVVCWGGDLFVLFLNYTPLHTFISSRKLRDKKMFSALSCTVVLSLKCIWK